MPTIPRFSIDFVGPDGESFGVPVLTPSERAEYTSLVRVFERPEKFNPGTYEPATDHEILRFCELTARLAAFRITRKEVSNAYINA